MYEGIEGIFPPNWEDENMPIDAVSWNSRFSVELDALTSTKQADSRRASDSNVDAQLRRVEFNPPVGNHPLKAHPPRPGVDRSMSGSGSGSYHSAIS